MIRIACLTGLLLPCLTPLAIAAAPETAARPVDLSEAQARLEMEAVGLEFVENRAMLPQQHFLVFRQPGPASSP